MFEKFKLQFLRNLSYNKKTDKWKKLYRDKEGNYYVGSSKWNAKFHKKNDNFEERT